LICLGDYTKNLVGTVYSVPIHVPKGKWFDKFKADYANTTENTVTFSILDGNGNVLETGLNGTGSGNDISNPKVFNSGIIQLYAELSRNNETDSPPVLRSWDVTWRTEDTSPTFKTNTFSGQNKWIHNNTPVFTITAFDSFPGLDISSAKYRLTYKTDETSDWFVAECSGVNGTQSNQTITADLSEIDINPDLSLKTIEISIKDLSGNVATFKFPESFKLDKEKPTSWISSTFLPQYNEPVNIKANASDPGDSANSSGIKSIALFYRLKGGEIWTIYNESLSPYEWNFETNISGIYEVCTIATDNAGNLENFPDETVDLDSFLLDMKEPNPPEFNEEGYSFNKLPEFSGDKTITFSDDYKLEAIYYRPNFEAKWELADSATGIDKAEYAPEWTIKQEYWDNMTEGKEYYIYFKVIDFCGNQYETPSNDEAHKIVKDLTTSKPYLDLSDFEEWHWDNEFIIKASIPDVDKENITNVVLLYRYSSDNKDWSDWEQYGDNISSAPFEWEFTAMEGNGYYEFKTQITDTAGNVGESEPESANVTQFPTGLITTMIILVVILLIVTVFVLKKMKKKT